MDIITDNSTQSISSLANVNGTYNPFITASDLTTSLASKQDTLTSGTTLLGVGSSISALDYGKITLNIPQYFPTSWANVASKPTDFPSSWGNISGKPDEFTANWNTTITNKPDLTVYYNKTESDAKFAILANNNTFAGDVIINGTTKRLSFGSRTEDFLIYLWGSVYGLGVNASTFRLNAPADASYKFYTGPTNNTMTLNNAGVLSTTGGITLTTPAKFTGDGSGLTALNYNNITNNALSFQTPLSKNAANQVSINLTAYQPIINTYAISGATGGTFGFATGTLTLGMPTTYTALSIASLTSTTSITYKGAEISDTYQPKISTYSITGATGGTLSFATGTLTLAMPTTYTALSIASLTSTTSITYKGAEISSSYLKLDGTNTMTGALNITNNTTDNQIVITNTATNRYNSIKFTNGTQNGFIGIGNGAIGGYYQTNFFVETTNNIILQCGTGRATTATPRMIIMGASGKIGIGTGNPLQAFHIQAPNNAILRIETDTSDINQVSGIEFGIPAFTSVQSAKITSTSISGDKSDLKFYTRNGTASNSSNYMTLSSSGNLILNNQLVDIRLQLWDGYGFGINDSTLRYNAGTYHRFYNNSVFSATIYNKGLLLNCADYNTGGTRGIYFRNGYDAANNYNCCIVVYDHNGDTFADGLSISGYDGVSFCTGSDVRQERMRVKQDGNININNSLNIGTTLTGATNVSKRAYFTFTPQLVNVSGVGYRYVYPIYLPSYISTVFAGGETHCNARITIWTSSGDYGAGILNVETMQYTVFTSSFSGVYGKCRVCGIFNNTNGSYIESSGSLYSIYYSGWNGTGGATEKCCVIENIASY